MARIMDEISRKKNEKSAINVIKRIKTNRSDDVSLFSLYFLSILVNGRKDASAITKAQAMGIRKDLARIKMARVMARLISRNEALTNLGLIFELICIILKGI